MARALWLSLTERPWGGVNGRGSGRGWSWGWGVPYGRSCGRLLLVTVPRALSTLTSSPVKLASLPDLPWLREAVDRGQPC
ncbi:hypothetical protein chiPu_0029079, partial [Chiloscyllium punctatum]|nr:hypothetical protein [Chiloscyllium punctatum]